MFKAQLRVGVISQSMLSQLVRVVFLLYINDLPDDVICNIAIYTDVATTMRHCGLGQEVTC